MAVKSKLNNYSDGYYHFRLTLLFVPIAAIVGALCFFIPLLWWERAIICALSCLIGGAVVTCDLDQDVWVTATKIWFRIPLIGWLLGFAYAAYWFPYAYFFKHRGISHSIFFGTLTRVIYILVWTPIVLMCWKAFILLYLGEVLTIQALLVVLSQWSSLLLGSLWQGILIAIGFYINDVSHIGRDYKNWQI